MSSRIPLRFLWTLFWAICWSLFWAFCGTTAVLCAPEAADLVPAADAYVSSTAPTTSFGAAPDLFVGTRKSPAGGVEVYRSLLRFDLGKALPAGAVLEKAVLRLFLYTSTSEAVPPPPAPLQVQANAAAWSETAVTWKSQPGLQAIAPVEADLPLGPGYHEWEVTAIVQGWLDETRPNFGFSLRNAAETVLVGRGFRSREFIPEPPHLYLEYSLPKPGDIDVAPPVLDFGEVEAGAASLPRIVIVKNAGQGGLTLSQIISTSSSFLLADPPAVPYTLSAGAQLALALEFRPTSVSTESGLLQIESDDPDEPRALVALIGRGTPPLLLSPGPQEVEGSLAEGKARFSWFNPLPYREVRVFDQAGGQVAVLPGDATSVEIPAPPNATSLRFRFQGIDGEGAPGLFSDAFAIRPVCSRPPPLNATGVPGDLDLSVWGDHSAASVSRCEAAAGGGGLAAGGGGGGIGAGGTAPGGGAVRAGAAGHVVYHRELEGGVVGTDPYALTTGFVLEEDADKLEITARYRKVATEFGLTLRGRLRRVHPAEDFTDEFTFADVVMEAAKKDYSVVYFRADKDVGHVPDPADEGPDGEGNELPQPCLDAGGDILKIPRGEYLLDLYAVGGDRETPYYVFADAAGKEDLLIPGSPCPPYPYVEVKDFTGIATFPQVSDVEARVGPCAKAGPLTDAVTFSARGTWVDEDGEVRDIAEYGEAHPVEYRWHLTFAGGIEKVTSSPSLTLCSADEPYGCYRVRVAVHDLACDIEREFTHEVAVLPPDVERLAEPDRPSFHLIRPNLSGIYGIVGLKPPPDDPPLGEGEFTGTRRVEFTVLVVPAECGDDIRDCPALTVDDLLVRLAFPALVLGIPVAEGDAIHVENLCPNAEAGPVYFNISIADLSALPAHGVLPSDGTFRSVNFQVKCSGAAVAAGDCADAGSWRNLADTTLRLTNAPPTLDTSFWAGRFDPESESYAFDVRPARGPLGTVDVGASDEASFDLLGIDIEVPSTQNSVQSGFTGRFAMAGGEWAPLEGSGAMIGELMGNRADGKPFTAAGEVGGGGGAWGRGGSRAGGGVVDPEDLIFEWCRSEVIIDEQFQQQIFQGVIWAGAIGPIPVVLSAAIGIGLDIQVTAKVSTRIAPFEALVAGGPAVENHFYLLSCLDVQVPAEVRADIVGGIFYLSFQLNTDFTGDLDVHLGNEDTRVDFDRYARFDLEMSFQAKGCVDLFFDELCKTFGPYKLLDENLLSAGADTIRDEAADKAPCGENPSCGDGEGGGGGGVGGDPIPPLGAASLDVSPNGEKVWGILLPPDGTLSFCPDSECADDPCSLRFCELPTRVDIGYRLADAEIKFLSNDDAIIVATASPLPGVSPAVPPDFPETAEEIEEVRRDEIRSWNLSLSVSDLVAIPIEDGEVQADRFYWLADGVDKEARERRADGRPIIARDPAEESVLAAWVRFDTAEDDLDVVVRRDTDVNLPAVAEDGVRLLSGRSRSVPNYQPRLERTEIYVRRLGLDGADEPGKRKVSNGGLNLEPSLAVSPSGDAAYCVWVHDPVHEDLATTNLGRRLLYSVYSKEADSWSAAASVLSDLRDYDSKCPGALEPNLMLAGDDQGLLVFTALQPGAAAWDTGLSPGSRFLYGVRLEGGAFGELIVIRRDCGPAAGFKPTLVLGHFDPGFPEIIDAVAGGGGRGGQAGGPGTRFLIPVVYQGSGPAGVRAGSGDVMAAIFDMDASRFTNPVSLTPDRSRHSRIAAARSPGALYTVHLNEGPSSLREVRAGNGARGRRFELMKTPLESDAAITGCDLSQPFAAPGAIVAAEVKVENSGLAGTPVTKAGASLVGLKAYYAREDGSRRLVRQELLPHLSPGQQHVFQWKLEMPHDPVTLVVELDPNPVDRDRTNDRRECLFGAPRPRDLLCEVIQLADDTGRAAVRLSWRNPVLYDEIRLYRNGAMLGILSGSTTWHIDPMEPGRPGDQGAPGGLTYAVRGRVASSRSARSTCTLEAEEVLFRRGDCNGDRSVDISDALCVLGYLFLGGAEPSCQDSLDATDDGALDLSDGIRILGALFLGGAEIPSPGALRCGPDHTADRLPPCRYPPAACP